MVKSPDPKLFEQAIFIMREDAAGGVTAEQVLQEAQRAADGYLRRNSRWGRRLGQIPPPIYVALGGLLASLAWGAAIYFPLLF
ncbi:hypothetical protein SDC9_77412 [bioreactor metagenome]|uniref:Uncharacterized protein n=1 Tax=bioreactor metagenome TaxID=1076179 RepID=A0A644YSM1_9ZZZZ